MIGLIIGALSLAISSYANVVDCGGLFKITELYQSPDIYVNPGQNVSLTLKYDVPYGFSTNGGTATNTISINGIPLGTSTDDLCTKISCPIYSGPHDGSSWAAFPSGVSGKIISKVVWKDTQNTQLLCLQSTLKTASTQKNYLRRAHAGFIDLIPIYDIESSSSSSSGNSTSSGSSNSSGGSSGGSSSGSSSGNSANSTSSGSSTGSASSSIKNSIMSKQLIHIKQK